MWWSYWNACECLHTTTHSLSGWLTGYWLYSHRQKSWIGHAKVDCDMSKPFPRNNNYTFGIMLFFRKPSHSLSLQFWMYCNAHWSNTERQTACLPQQLNFVLFAFISEQTSMYSLALYSLYRLYRSETVTPVVTIVLTIIIQTIHTLNNRSAVFGVPRPLSHTQRGRGKMCAAFGKHTDSQ